METLLTTIYDEEETHSRSSIFNFFLTYVNVLEGIKTQIKNVHWASLRLPNSDKRGAHLYLDDFLEVVGNFQDLVAESAMGITGESLNSTLLEVFHSLLQVQMNSSSIYKTKQ